MELQKDKITPGALQNLLIVLKNVSTDQLNDDVLSFMTAHVYEGFNVDHLATIFLEYASKSGRSAQEKEVIANAQKLLLVLSQISTQNIPEDLTKHLVPICMIEDQDRQFTLTLFSNLIQHEAALASPESPLVGGCDQFLMMLGKFIQESEAGLSQKSIQALVKYMNRLEAVEKKAGIPIIEQLKDKFVAVLMEALQSTRESNKTVYIRFFEVAVELAISSKQLSDLIARPAVSQVFADFFGVLSSDVLSQVTIMDFVVKLSESPYGVSLMNESGFIAKLFQTYGGGNEDSFGFISSSMLLVGAKLYSLDSSLFNPFENANYMKMFRAYMCGPIDLSKPHLKDIALSCLHFFFSRRDHCLVPYFIEKEENHDVLNHFIRVAKTTNEDHRKAFIVALRSMLKFNHLDKESTMDQRISDITQMIFSNLMTPQNVPSEFGQIDTAITHLVSIADTPFDNEEILCLRMFKQLVKHRWGAKAFFANGKAIQYILTRKSAYKASADKEGSDKNVVEKKYSVVDQIIRESKFLDDATIIDPIVASQLGTYHTNGVYGISGGSSEMVPELATMNQ